MKAIVNGRIILPDALLKEDAALLFDSKVQGVVSARDVPENVQTLDAKGLYVSPGLVDVHIHGYDGADSSDGDAEGVRKMARGIAKNGVTSWLPTTMTVSKSKLCEVFDTMRGLREESRQDDWDGAEILGVHAEGPFINVSKKGAQNAEHILLPDAGLVHDFADILRIVTLAPEVEGAMAFIEDITRSTSVVLAIGHTNATYETAVDAIWHGVSHVTHTFNAMTPLSHRAPGVVGAALTSPVTAELIADTFHIHPGLFPLMAKAKGERLVLITDCTRAGGLADGTYDLGGQEIFVKGIECRLKDGTIAGSVLKLNDAVANMRAHTDLPIWQAVNMASRNAAASIGQTNKGSLEAGKDADIVLFDEAVRVHRTILRGRTIYEAK